MKEIIMGNIPAEEIAKEAQYYDVKRLLIQERGEDEYYFLYERKHKQLQDKLDDEITRKDLNDNLGHFYNPKDKSRLEFQRQMQIKAMQNAEMKKHKRTKKVIRYRLGYQASEIKDKILRFMTTFNPSTQPNNDET
jgi:carboxylesterase type B